MSNQLHTQYKDNNEESKENQEFDSPFEYDQKLNSKNKPLEDEEENKKESENLMEKINPNKLKQLIDAHVGGGPFSEAILERKKYSFELLKLWDMKKCELLHNHKSVLETFVKKIEKKQEFLKNAMQIVMKFFSQKVNQEADYIVHYQKKIPKLNTIYQEVITKKNEDIDTMNGEPLIKEKKDLFPEFSRCFEEIDQLMLVRQKKIENYKISIEKEIVKDLLMKENEEYEKAIQNIRDEIIDLRRKLNKANSATADNSTKHAKLFTEMLEPSTKLQLESKDLYNSEIILLSSSEEQLKLHRSLAKHTLSFWQKLTKLEANRLKVVQKAFQQFLTLSEEHFKPSAEYSNLQMLLLNLEFTDDLEKFLDLENCFTSKKLSFF